MSSSQDTPNAGKSRTERANKDASSEVDSDSYLKQQELKQQETEAVPAELVPAELAPSIDETGAVVIGDEAKIVSARGTEEGLVLRIDGTASWEAIISELDDFLGGSRRFFRGGEVSVEWLEQRPGQDRCEELETALKSQYDLKIAPLSKTRLSRYVADSDSLRGSGAVDQESMHQQPGHRGALQANESAPGASYSPESRGDGNSDAGKSKAARAGRNFDKPYQPRFSVIHSKASRKSEQADSGDSVSGNDSGNGGLLESVDSFLKKFSGSGETGVEDTSAGSYLNNMMSGTGQGSLAGRGSTAGQNATEGAMERLQRVLGEELFGDEDANAKILFGTLRSGQRIETPFSLIVIGDVNPGADLVAGGDIIVLGSLRGTAHASAYNDDSFENVIIAMHMQPMQLRIGSIISRGSDEIASRVEIARIENRRIIVEPYNPRILSGRRS